jgi:hypothetical protein
MQILRLEFSGCLKTDRCVNAWENKAGIMSAKILPSRKWWMPFTIFIRSSLMNADLNRDLSLQFLSRRVCGRVFDGDARPAALA